MKRLWLMLLALTLAGLVLGLVHLFRLRFETGDNYPAYSSLRADPLGSKALYESLSVLLPTQRHFRSLAKLGEGEDTTLFYLGADAEALRFTAGEFRGLETFVRRGGRLVIALLPRYQAPPRLGGFLTRGGPRTPPMPGTNQPPGVPPALRPPSPQDAGAELRTVSSQDRWAFSLRQSALVRSNGLYQPALARRQAESSLPATWSVRGAFYFAKLDPVWRVVYARQESTNEFPVLIERPLGAGAVVLCADSYPFSNESLRRDRQATLLAWFAGHNHRIVFEETHLGARETPGIAAMGREYHLEGVFFAALVLAGLFVWKNAASFMPPYEEQQARECSEFIAGKDSAAGFINLLRRNIAPPDLMKTCLEQWNAQPATPGGPSRSKLEAMQKIIDAENALEPKQRNPVRTYQQFCEILAHRPRIRAPGSTLTGAGSDPRKRSGDHPEDGPANATL